MKRSRVTTGALACAAILALLVPLDVALAQRRSAPAPAPATATPSPGGIPPAVGSPSAAPAAPQPAAPPRAAAAETSPPDPSGKAGTPAASAPHPAAGTAPSAAPPADAAAPAPASPPAPPAIFSPFGPGYDPLREPPTEPVESGRGLTSAKLVAAGPIEVEELTKVDTPPPALFGVLLDVNIAESSTTPLMNAETVVAKPQAGDAVPLFVVCLPTAGEPLSLFRAGGSRLLNWHVAIDGRTFHCGGRNARLATEVGGIRLTTKSPWQGALLLVFKAEPDMIRRVVLPGAEVELPQPPGAAGKPDAKPATPANAGPATPADAKPAAAAEKPAAEHPVPEEKKP